MFQTKDDLLHKSCKACSKNDSPLDPSEIKMYLKDVPEWHVTADYKSIYRKCTVKDFMKAVGFIHAIGHIAEQQGHHPDIHLTGYKHLTVEFSTHAIGGLSDNDFIMASKIDEILDLSC